MDSKAPDVVPSAQPPKGPNMLAASLVDRVRELSRDGKGIKIIARILDISRNTVRRYLAGAVPEYQVRPNARRWDQAARDLAVELYRTVADGNVVVVQQELHLHGLEVPLRSLQAILAPLRRERLARRVATVRFETEPGDQIQIDFGEHQVMIAGSSVKVHLMGVVLGHSRRIYCRPFLAERQDDWVEGIQEALEHFGGRPRRVLTDNASPLVTRHDSKTREVDWNPAFASFCKDRDIQPEACLPGRPRTKGKIERVVGYVKHNALANRAFPSFAALKAHLITWAVNVADRRIHGTTRERPAERFERNERGALRPLAGPPLAVRTQRLTRKVAAEGHVEVDTVKYSVPHRHVREQVTVVIDRSQVEIWLRGTRIALHNRCEEPHAHVRDPKHWEGLYKTPPSEAAPPAPAAPANRLLSAYEEIVEGPKT